MVDNVVRRTSVLVALGLAASTACGGISTRSVGDGESGSGGDDGSGGSATGGRNVGGSSTGGRGATGGRGGKGSGGVTTGAGGGMDDGGAFTGAVGGVGVGGAVGGSGGIGGVGAVGEFGGVGGVGAVGAIGGVGGSVGGTPSDPYRVPWDAKGYLSPDQNLFDIQGNFYFSTDCGNASSAMLPCTQGDPNFVGPDGQTGWALSDAVACVRGKVPQVTNNPTTGMPAYDLQWGALLGIFLSKRGGAAPYSALDHGIVGFSLDIVGIGPTDVRVNVVTPQTVGVSHFVTALVPEELQRIHVRFAEALQGSWVTQPVPLDTTQISGIELHVYTNTSSSRAFDFCLTNLRVLTD